MTDEQNVAGSQGGQSQDTGQAGSASPPDWETIKSSLGDLGKEKVFEPIKDLKGLAESYVNAQKMIGRGIFLPDKNAKPEDVQKAKENVLKKLRDAGFIEAVPGTPEDYDLKFPTEDRFGNELKPNEPLVQSFRQTAHKLGLSPSAAQGLLDWYLNYQSEAEAQEQAEFEKMKRELKNEWGGLYIRRMEAARRAAAKYIGNDSDDVISSLPPHLGKRIVTALSKIGESLIEDELIAGVIPGAETAESLKKKIDAIVNDPNHPFYKDGPGHKEAVDEYTKLFRAYVALGGKK